MQYNPDNLDFQEDQEENGSSYLYRGYFGPGDR